MLSEASPMPSDEEGAEDEDSIKLREEFDFANKDGKKWKSVAHNRGLPAAKVAAYPPSSVKEWKDRIENRFYELLVADGGEKWLPLCMSRSMGYMLSHNLRKKYEGVWDAKQIQTIIEVKYPDMLKGGVIPRDFFEQWSKSGETDFGRSDEGVYSIKMPFFITDDFDVSQKVMEKLEVHAIMTIMVVDDEKRKSRHAVVGFGKSALDITPKGNNAYSIGRHNFRQLIVVDVVASESKTRKAPELQLDPGWTAFFDAALQTSREPVGDTLQELEDLRAFKKNQDDAAAARAKATADREKALHDAAETNNRKALQAEKALQDAVEKNAQLEQKNDQLEKNLHRHQHPPAAAPAAPARQHPPAAAPPARVSHNASPFSTPELKKMAKRQGIAVNLLIAMPPLSAEDFVPSLFGAKVD